MPAKPIEKVVQAIARGHTALLKDEVFVGLGCWQLGLRDELDVARDVVEGLRHAVRAQRVLGYLFTRVLPRRKPWLRPIDVGQHSACKGAGRGC